MSEQQPIRRKFHHLFPYKLPTCHFYYFGVVSTFVSIFSTCDIPNIFTAAIIYNGISIFTKISAVSCCYHHCWSRRSPKISNFHSVSIYYSIICATEIWITRISFALTCKIILVEIQAENGKVTTLRIGNLKLWD